MPVHTPYVPYELVAAHETICAVNIHKNDLCGRRLGRCWRDGVAGGAVGGRAAGADRVAGGADPPLRQAGLPLHGWRIARSDNAYFIARAAGRGRSRYAPSALVAVVRAGLARGEQVEAVLAEISAINAELLARRELS